MHFVLFLTKLDEVCYDFVLLILKSVTKGLCASVIGNISDKAMPLTQITVKLLIDNINHQYSPYCGSVGSSTPSDQYEFSCALSFEDLEEVEFTIKAYNTSTSNQWRAKLKIGILHQCTKGTLLVIMYA